MTDYEVVIGLEIHTQLLTESKLFCGCSTKFGAAPNSNICPVCTGQPGVLPVLNQKAVELGIKTSLALDCQIQEWSRFARKNYFYPDLPKNFQISMYELPIASDGYLDIDAHGETKRVRIVRTHLEEDAGKLVHLGSERLTGSTGSLVDFNRTGVPLLEIVSYPDMRSPEEAKAYVQELRSILIHLGISDGNMEEGSLRCDANISLRKRGEDLLGVKTEIKNMNSFRSIQGALQAEIERQTKVLQEGGRIVQETRHFDLNTGQTISLRSKEEAHDYRYFPEPDLVPLHISKEWQEKIRATIGELPREKRKRFVSPLGLEITEALALCSEPTLTRFFEECLKFPHSPKLFANWILGDISAYLNTEHKRIDQTKIQPAHLAQLIELIQKGTISGKIAKSLLAIMMESGKSPSELVEKESLTQITDETTLRQAIQKVISENPKPAGDFRSGKPTALTFLVGLTMKATQGRASPDIASRILKEELGKTSH